MQGVAAGAAVTLTSALAIHTLRLPLDQQPDHTTLADLINREPPAFIKW